MQKRLAKTAEPNRDAVWGIDSGGLKKPLLDRVQIPGKGNFGGNVAAHV